MPWLGLSVKNFLQKVSRKRRRRNREGQGKLRPPPREQQRTPTFADQGPEAHCPIRRDITRHCSSTSLFAAPRRRTPLRESASARTGIRRRAGGLLSFWVAFRWTRHSTEPGAMPGEHRAASDRSSPRAPYLTLPRRRLLARLSWSVLARSEPDDRVPIPVVFHRLRANGFRL